MEKKEVKKLEINSCFSANWKKYLFFLTLFFIGILIILLVVYFLSNVKEESFLPISTCSDGTFYNTCSLDKPYYCLEGVLIENASICGCPKNFSKIGNKCSSIYSYGEKDINLSYVLLGENNFINFRVYEGVENYLINFPNSITYKENEKPFRLDFVQKNINEEISRSFLISLLMEIRNRAYTPEEQARIVISLVQHIPYEENYTKNSENFSYYPYSVLYNFKGECGRKSELLAFLLREIGYGVVLFYYAEENHQAVGIKCPVEYSLDNSGYCFIESTSPAIITNNQDYYLRLGKLTSKPELIFVSRGISLEEDMEEYEDAKDWIKLNEILSQGKNLNKFQYSKFEKLKERYGLYY